MSIVLFDRNTGKTISTLPHTRQGVTKEKAIQLCGGEIIANRNDPRWNDVGDNIIFGDQRYWPEDLDFTQEERSPAYMISAINSYLSEQGWTVFGQELQQRLDELPLGEWERLAELYEEMEEYKKESKVYTKIIVATA